MDLSRLLKFGYFPKELPPPFTTSEFGNFALSSTFPKIKRDYTSRPCIHNLARPGNQRRVLSIPNPFNYFLLAKTLVDNKDQVELQLDRSNISVSRPVVDDSDFRGYLPAIGGNDLLKRRASIRAGARYIVRTDISRFYYSIYTHSIPWALNGKSIAKSNRKNGFGNDLDRYVRNAQDAQTLGIPVGPDVSFIISEMLCGAIDEEIQKNHFRGLRFIDDFEFAFLTRSEAEQAIPKIEAILRNFELALNPLKTHIDELPVIFENPWKLKVKRFPFSVDAHTSQLLEYFDLLFELHKQNRNEPVLRYGIARLRSLKFDNEELLVDLLVQCILVEPGTLKEAFFLIDTLEINVNSSRLSQVVLDLISIHGPMRHGSEVAWALWIALLYDVKIPDSIIEYLADFDDSVIALLTLHARSKKLVSKKVKDFWQHLMTSESLTDGHWLIAYEADIKGWLASAEARNHIDRSDYFSALKEHKVSFYDKDVDLIMNNYWLSNSYDAGLSFSINADDEDDDGLAF